MNRHSSALIDLVLTNYFASLEAPVPRLPWAEVETLLVDDADRRLALARHFAQDSGEQAATRRVTIVDDHLLVTDEGLVYVAALRPLPGLPGPVTSYATMHTGSGGEEEGSYYLAAPSRLFDDLVDRTRASQGAFGCTVIVDSRWGHELDYLWPADSRLRSMLGAHEVMDTAYAGTPGGVAPPAHDDAGEGARS